MYEKFYVKLADKLIKKFGRNIAYKTFCTHILSEYSKHINYFSEKYSHDLSSLSALKEAKNIQKLNSLSEVRVADKTIKDFLRPFLDNQIKHEDDLENINKELKVKKPHPKTLDYLCVSLGYFGWIDFRTGKKKKDIPHIIESDSKIFVKENAEGFKEDDSLPHFTVASIPGATTIDENFIQKIKEHNKFTRNEFYTAKYDKDCAWWGISQSLDVKRKYHALYLEIAKNAFTASKYRKVEMVFHGLGGSGKSTVIRRIAYDFCLEKPKGVNILWMDDFRKFFEEGLGMIRFNSGHNYLVFIEDWHRLSFTCSEKEALAFFERTNDMPNIRIILVDRDTVGKAYRSYLNQSDHLFLIGSEENENIIKGVVEKNPEWKPTYKKIFSQHKNYASSLFLLLFILSRIAENEHQEFPKNVEPEAEFAHIVLSDMQYLAQLGYPGLAKAIHYWACIYKKSRIVIGFETFLRIADYYNGDQKTSRHFSNWNKKHDTVLNLLRNYISITEDFENAAGNSYGMYTAMKYRAHASEQFHVMEFSHDMLADVGLSVISLENTRPYDDTIVEEFNDIILERGDLFSIHQYFQFYWNRIGDYATTQEKIACLKRLIQKTPEYLQRDLYQKMSSLRLDLPHLEDFFSFLRRELPLFPAPLLSYASQSRNKKSKRQYELLLNVLTQKQLWKKFSIARLHFLLKKADPEIVYNFYQKILRERDFRSIPKEILMYVMDLDFRNHIPASLLAHSSVDDPVFMRSAFYRLKNNCAMRILEDPHWKSTDPKLIAKALHYADSYHRTIFLNHEFNLANLRYFSVEAIAEALLYSENQEVMDYYLKRAENLHLPDDILFALLSCFENAETLPAVVETTIERIINGFRFQQSQDGNKLRKNRRFARLMQIGFHRHPLWKEASQSVINQSGNEAGTDNYTYYIVDVLHGYRMLPEIVEEECRRILESWKSLGILNHIVNPMRYKNLIIALSHPRLSTIALETAKAVCHEISDEATVKEHLQSVETFENSRHPQPKNYFLMGSDPFKIIKDVADKRKIPQWDWNDWKNLSLQIRFF